MQKSAVDIVGDFGCCMEEGVCSHLRHRPLATDSTLCSAIWVWCTARGGEGLPTRGADFIRYMERRGEDIFQGKYDLEFCGIHPFFRRGSGSRCRAPDWVGAMGQGSMLADARAQIRLERVGTSAMSAHGHAGSIWRMTSCMRLAKWLFVVMRAGNLPRPGVFGSATTEASLPDFFHQTSVWTVALSTLLQHCLESRTGVRTCVR